MEAVFSYAGRTGAPLAQPLPVRVGGFGGADGLAAWLRAEGIAAVVDATHPFAAGISANAVDACAVAGVPLIALERAPWRPGAGDRWTGVADLGAAVAALAGPGERVFLALGRQHVGAFAAQPQHRYLLRLVDPPGGALPLAGAEVVVARGPFDLAGDLELMRRHAVTRLVARNSGGAGARAKLDAARILGLPVVMIERPVLPARRVAADVAAVVAWLHAVLGV